MPAWLHAKVVHGAGRDSSDEQIFCGASAQSGAHLVQHLFLCGNLAFFGQVPGCSQSTSAWNDGYLNQRVGIFQQPGDVGVSGLVYGNGTAFFFGCDFGFFSRPPTIRSYRIQEVLLFLQIFSMTGGNQGGFVADIGDVGAEILESGVPVTLHPPYCLS